MLRVDQAGEYGATQIYAGQIAVMGDRSRHADKVAAMAAQEADHRRDFDALLAARGARPTLLQPLWHVAGFALGAATALAGPEVAMACTAAIETEIDEHYTRQLDDLGDDDPELAALVTRARDDEREHHAEAMKAGAERAPGYPVLSRAIRLGCRLAIRLSERI
jgi:ubiquinone biosynthesis monooxygenase Coq7